MGWVTDEFRVKQEVFDAFSPLLGGVQKLR